MERSPRRGAAITPPEAAPELGELTAETLFAALPEPALLLERASLKILRTNRWFAELTGRPAAQWAGLAAELALHPHDEPLWERLRGGAAASGDCEPPVYARVRVPGPAGEPHTFQCLAVPLASGPHRMWLVQLRSTQRHLLEASPEDTGRTTYQDLFDHATDLIYSHDLDGQILSANPALLRLFDLTLDDALQSSIWDWTDRERLDEVRRQIEEEMNLGGYSRPYEMLFHRRDGQPVWLELSTRLIVEGGRPHGVHGIGRDITERKLAQQALDRTRRDGEEQRFLLERMIEENPYAIAFWSVRGTLERCNPAYERLFGFVPPADYRMISDPQVRSLGIVPKLREAFEGRTVRIEDLPYDAALVPGGNHPSRPVRTRVTLFPLVGPDGRVHQIVSFFEDTTDQHAAAQARQELESQLQEAQKLKAIGTLAGGVAHDFNNLLTGLLGYLDVMRTMADPKLHGFIDKSVGLAKRGSDLTRQLLAYARRSQLETCIHDLNATAVEVSALIKQTVDRRIRVETTLSEIPATLAADPGQMSQTLLNLCVNARDSLTEKLAARAALGAADAPEDWEPTLAIETRRVQVGADFCRRHPEARPGAFIRATVRDNGVGMDEATRARIFEPFFTTKSLGRGTGLGLATLFGIVKQHRGWVEVRSEAGAGATFHVYLPAVDAPAVPLSQAAASLRVRGGPETIFIVDDEESIRDMGRQALERLGYTVMLAADGREGLDIFEREHAGIDLVVLDIAMPRLSGREILPRLLALKPEIRIVVTTGYAFDQSEPFSLESAHSAFVHKPYTPTDLAQTVRRLLDA